jgi:hypothetical protein
MHKHLAILINDIKTHTLIPTKLYKNVTDKNISLEIESKRNAITLLYKNETDLTKDYGILEREVFNLLEFNPYYIPPVII